MQVETFECEETATEHVECTDEAIKLIDQLGLHGQQALIGKGEKKDRCPYREMTAEESFVYRLLCPQMTQLEKYSSGPVPLRVLRVAAHAKSLGIFDDLAVLHRASPAVKDPVLIGITKNPDRTWETRAFILARWGESLEEWPAMVKSAMAIWREQIKESIDEASAKVRTAAESLDGATLATAMRMGTRLIMV